jgi:leader peptidase (prepilin peptidase)/N-methyltransferase
MTTGEVALRAVVSAVAGLAVGSFMTVVVDRVPKKESVVVPRSRCPSCGTQILARDNIPVVSWLLLRGRCRSCGVRISPLYPLTELTTAALVVGAVMRYRSLWQGIMVATMLALMPAVSITDVRHRIIPNRLMYPSLVGFPVLVVIGWSLGGPLDPARAGIGLLVYGGGLLLVAMVSRGMGMGDVKLAAVIGVVFGAIGLRYVAVAAGAAVLFGGLGGLLALALGKGRKSAIPFGPYLAAGAVVAAFWGHELAHWYLRTFVPA